EWGLIWAYDGIDWQPVSDTVRCAGPENGRCALPVGQWRTDLMGDYLDQMFDWLTTYGAAYRIERWFLYTLHPGPEWWSPVMGGIALVDQLDSLTLTPMGERYQAWAKSGRGSPASGGATTGGTSSGTPTGGTTGSSTPATLDPSTTSAVAGN